MISFLQIKTFVAVVEAGGFIAAEASLHRSQPSITNTIKKLEATLEYKLFDRSHYRPELTAKGKIFYHKAEILLRQISEFEDSVAGFKSDFVEPEFTIDIDNALPVTTCMPMIESLIKTFPDTRFSLRIQTQLECIQRLKRQESNICIIASAGNNGSNPERETNLMENIDYLPLSFISFIKDTDLDNTSALITSIYAMRLRNQEKGTIAIHAWELLDQIR